MAVYVRKQLCARVARIATCLGASLLVGCGGGFFPTGAAPRSTLNLAALDSDNESTFWESNPNDLLGAAAPVPATQESRVIRGSIDDPNDIDVYDLGPVVPGDRVLVRMAADAVLDAALALFDADGAALLINDHRNVFLGKTEPFLDVVIRHTSPACYAVVASTPGYLSEGDYGLIVSKTPGSPPPSPRPDTILVIFSGDEKVRIGSRAAVDVPPFDAADIADDFAGQTPELVALVLKKVRDDYAGLDVTILSTTEGAVYDGSMTRLFFGTYDPTLLGVAEGVDEFNATGAQEAIVFADTFTAFAKLDPTLDELAAALANVASHEIGHLLGLVHTRDAKGIMDVTASLQGMMLDQRFSMSPLHGDVFPLGSQDARQLLFDTIGGDAGFPFVKPSSFQQAKDRHESDGPPARERLDFSSCTLDEPH